MKSLNTNIIEKISNLQTLFIIIFSINILNPRIGNAKNTILSVCIVKFNKPLSCMNIPNISVEKVYKIKELIINIKVDIVMLFFCEKCVDKKYVVGIIIKHAVISKIKIEDSERGLLFFIKKI